MQALTMKDFLAEGIERMPAEDDLPYSDGDKLESERHVFQMYLLIEPLRLHWAGRDDAYVGGDMFFYFGPEQVRNQDFRGPDVFAATGVRKRERKSWVVWQEGQGPDVVIELISESTARFDKTEKKRIYLDRVQVPEYYWFDPFTAEFAGFHLRGGVYEPIPADDAGRRICKSTGLMLGLWGGVYSEIETRWLRWMTPDDRVLPTGAEREEHRADEEERRADAALRRVAELEASPARSQPDAGNGHERPRW